MLIEYSKICDNMLSVKNLHNRDICYILNDVYINWFLLQVMFDSSSTYGSVCLY